MFKDFISAKVISSAIIVIAILLVGTSIYAWQKSTVTHQPPTVGDISTWQTYSNDEYGFELKYPEGLKVSAEQMLTNVRPGLSVIFTDKPTPLPPDAHHFYPLQIYAFKKTDVPLTALRRLQLGKFDVRDLLYPLKNEQEVEGLTQGYTFTNIEVLKVDDLEAVFTKVGHPLAGEPEQVVIFGKDEIYAFLSDYSPLQNLTPREFTKSILTEFKISEPQAVADTASWKTYRNDEYGFEFKHPADFIKRNEKVGTEGRLAAFDSEKRGVITVSLSPGKLERSNLPRPADEPVKDIQMGGKNGYQLLTAEGTCGESRNFASLSDKRFIELDFIICESHSDPFTKDWDSILSTFKFTK